LVSKLFDSSNIKPQKISWRMDGMIAAVGSVLLTPWNWYDNATAIDYTLSPSWGRSSARCSAS
jgi:NCS1 family nucleobase:cation symporter-1